MPFSATRDLWLVLKARDEGTRALRGFSREVRQVGDTVQLANMQASKSALLNTLHQQKLTGATKQQMLVTSQQIANIDRQIGQGRIVRASMEEQRVSAQRLSGTLGGLAGAATAFSTAMLAGSVFGVVGIKNLINASVAYDKQASLTRTQVDKFALSLDQIREIGLRVARSVAVPFEEVQTALFDIFSSMEVNGKQAEELLMVFSKGAVAGQTSIQASARATIGLLNAFQLPLTSVNHLMDLQFQLVQEGIGTYEEWAQRIGLVSPSAARAGQSVETMLAALAATTRMGISAARSGTAVARAFDAMSNPKTVKQLKKLGVNALDAKGKFRPLIDVLFEFRKEIQKLPQADRIAKILDIFKGAGGTIEARRFLQNMLLTPGNLELFKSIFDEMSKESGSFEKAYSIMADTTASKTQLLSNKWAAMKVRLGDSLAPSFMIVVDWLGRVLDKFEKLSPKTKKFIALFIAGSVVLLGVAGILGLMAASALAIAAAVAAAGVQLAIFLTIVAGIGAAAAGGIAVFTTLYQKSKTFRDEINKTGAELKKFYDENLVPIGRAIKTSWEETLLPALQRLWDKINNDILPILSSLHRKFMDEILPVAKDVGNTIRDYVIYWFHKIKDAIDTQLIPALDKAKQYYLDHKETIDGLIHTFGLLFGWIARVAALIAGALTSAVGIKILDAFFGLINVLLFVISLFIKFYEQGVTTVKIIKAIWDKIRELFNGDAVEIAKKAGETMVTGFISGILSMKDELLNTLKNLALSGINKFKQALGSHSPSKVFMQIGKDTMAGYALGIKSTMPAMKSNMVASTSGLTSAAVLGQNKGKATGTKQEINITTNEINPRRHAEELGWLLAGSS